jgi:hypothetical protein
MLLAYVKAAYYPLSLDDKMSVGEDEMNRRKGHNFLAAFAGLLAKRTLFARPGKDASVWGRLLRNWRDTNGQPSVD